MKFYVQIRIHTLFLNFQSLNINLLECYLFTKLLKGKTWIEIVST